MTTSRDIIVDGQDWIFVKDRFMERGSVYMSADSSLFLRTGEPDRINEEVQFAKDVYAHGFPVPEVVGQGRLDSSGYFIERAIGNKVLGQIFSEEYKSNKAVSNATFADFTKVSIDFFKAQLEQANTINTQSNLKEGIHLENVLQENPEFDTPDMAKAISKAESRLSDLPIVLTHGDFNPYNILPGGVIDFEHKFIAPFGFDVVGNIYQCRYWNFKDDTGAFRQTFDFSDDQIATYFAQVDDLLTQHSSHKVTDYLQDFIFLKSIPPLAYEKSVAEKPGGDKAKWQARKKMLDHALKQYIANKPINTKTWAS